MLAIGPSCFGACPDACLAWVIGGSTRRLELRIVKFGGMQGESAPQAEETQKAMAGRFRGDLIERGRIAETIPRGIARVSAMAIGNLFLDKLATIACRMEIITWHKKGEIL